KVARVDAVDAVGTRVLVERFVELPSRLEITRAHGIERRDQARPSAGTRNGGLNPDPGLIDASDRLRHLLHAGLADRFLRSERRIVKRRPPRTEVAHLPAEARQRDEAGALAV